MISVSFIDSGVGGLIYCDEFIRQYPTIPVTYIADTKFFPYGNYGMDCIKKRIAELVELVIKTLNPNIIVLACNTASVCALKYLRSLFSISFIGVVPAIKPVKEAGGKRMYMMSTTATKKNEYTNNLLKEFTRDITIFLRGFPELIELIEKMVLGRSEAYLQYIAVLLEKIVAEIKGLKVDSVVLACTHFLFILTQLRKLLPSDVHIYHSLEGVTVQIGRVLDTLIHQEQEKNTSIIQKKEIVPCLYVTDTTRIEDFKDYAKESKYQFNGILE